ncbi:DnaJ family domain-containing protein [Priestia taiwanensis]|uniref:DnaJ homologue subfamily C member 28 conserved domain-containing protein n=1 Tax=Priestia taiwanensis TaxID=1347902 RepID=A0A917ARC8_9BACI|nr:DnaJ family domain-containing protein [Priestia taiwanensis]MBM7363276.1 enterochelin esterase family protein [Priestia taiwanensis]GGE69081.1 hypothetical protein GCM10007140_18950 [Priestia taiwanensis]
MWKKKSVDKQIQKEEILMKDEKRGIHDYEDHLTAIIKRTGDDGSIDHLKGKPLNLDTTASYNLEKQMYKTMKDNNVLPPWIELGKGIDLLKAELKECKDEQRIRALVEDINKKVRNHNLACPYPAQKSGVRLEWYVE